jgi:hypothetical protein
MTEIAAAMITYLFEGVGRTLSFLDPRVCGNLLLTSI